MRDRIQRLTQNPRLLFWARAFLEVKTLNAIVTLFYLHRGVRIDQIFYLSIVWSIGTLLSEVPTGYLADRFGRRRTLLLGVILTLLSTAYAFVAQGFWQFAFQFLLMSFGFSCFSGTEEAVLYDGLKELGNERSMTKYNGRLQSARQMLKIFFPPLGAWIAKDLIESQFRIILGIDFVAQVLAFCLIFSLVEPKHTREVLKQEQGIFRESLETIRREPFLLRAALNKIFIFIASFLLWRIYQLYLGQFYIDTRWFAVFYFTFHAIVFTSHWYLDRIEGYLGSIPLLRWSVVVTLAGLFVALFFPQPTWIFLGSLVALIASSFREPVFAHAMNQRIKSRSRATTLSNLYVLKAVLDIPLLFLAGFLALKDPRFVYIVCILLCCGVLLFVPVRERDVLTVAAAEEGGESF
jgi:MFS family permease